MPSPFDGAGDPYRGSSYRGWIIVAIICIVVIAVIWIAFFGALDVYHSPVPSGPPAF